MWIDAHTHLTGDQLSCLLALPEETRLLVNVETPEQAAWLTGEGSPRVLTSVGLHPWRAAEPLEPLLPFFERADAIGEIGMDSVWCEVPLRRQREIFLRQLQLAEQMGKPVVLHLKGCEGECLPLVADFPGRKLVHWYSSPHFLAEYRALDCYFTVGPDWADETVRRVALETPLNRLLLETDGPDAVTWATGETLTPEQLPGWMNAHLGRVAALRGIDPALLSAQLEHNFKAFLGRDEA